MLMYVISLYLKAIDEEMTVLNYDMSQTNVYFVLSFNVAMSTVGYCLECATY